MVLEMRPEMGRLNVTAKGNFSLKEAERTFVEMIQAVARHKVSKVLVDGREVVGDPETMERFYYGEFAARTVWDFAERKEIPLLPRFAYVLKEPVLDPKRFGETVAVNRGMRVKCFEEVGEAVEWLDQVDS